MEKGQIMNEKLLPCPFCGNKVNYYCRFGACIECNTCGYLMSQQILGKDILVAWNNRAGLSEDGK